MEMVDSGPTGKVNPAVVAASYEGCWVACPDCLWVRLSLPRIEKRALRRSLWGFWAGCEGLSVSDKELTRQALQRETVRETSGEIGSEEVC